MEFRSLLVRAFDNLCSDVSLVAMDLPSKMALILRKNKWQVQIWMSQERSCEKDES